MNILVDIGHPGHVHLFRAPIQRWREHGHQVTIVSRGIPVALKLLDVAGLEYRVVSRPRRGRLGLALELAEHTVRLLPLLLRQRIDVTASVGGTYTVYAAWLMRCRRVVFTDTETAVFANRITFPFATRIVTPAIFPLDLGPRHVRYRGIHELAYLHPAVFQADPSVMALYGLHGDEPFSVVRLSAWGAAHDQGVARRNPAEYVEFMSVLSTLGRVVLIPEAGVPPELRAFVLDVRPEDYHHLLAFASCCVTEGATTAVEAALLGTPTLYVNPIRPALIGVMGDCGLIRIADLEEPLSEALCLLMRQQEAGNRRGSRRDQFVWDQCDVVEMIVDIVEDTVLSRKAG